MEVIFLTDQILIALISFAGILQAHLQAFLQRQDYQIIALNSSKKKVDKHNNLVERVYLN